MPDTASASADSSSAACGAGVVLDLTVLLGLPGVGRRRDSPVLKRLLGVFVAEMGRNVGQVRAAFAQDDRQALAWLLHRMKSSATAMGALGLGALARRLEGRLKAGLPLAPDDGEGIARAWRDVRQAVLDEGLLGPDELRTLEAAGLP